MGSVLIGIILIVAAAGSLVYFRPRDGRNAAAATMPLLGMLIPLALTSALALGFAMIVAGIYLR